jgi:hypothetical protein
MKIIKPTCGQDLRLWMWSELSVFSKGLIAAVPVLLFVLAFAVIPVLRHSIGEYSQIEGTVRSVGNYEVGGGRLRGRTAVIALVTLVDGTVVQASMSNGLQVTAGSKVVVREFPQNFGKPLYGIFSVDQGAR